jgi:hypothetical protein
MSIFGPRKVSKLSAWLDARRAHKAQRELPAYLEDRLAIASRSAPRDGEPPFTLCVAGDGRVSRLPNPKYVEPDPLAAPGDSDLRLRRGAMAADALLTRGYGAQEAMSRLALQLRGLEQEFSGIEGKERDFLKADRVPSRLLCAWLAALVAASLLALGELAALTLVIADWLGVDLARADTLLGNPVESGAVLLASAGIFVASVMLASKVLEGEDPLHRILCAAGLLVVGVGLGFMRAIQIPSSGWQQAFIFILVTIAIPLGVAALQRRAGAAYALLGEWRKFQRQKRLIRHRMAAIEHARMSAERELGGAIGEFADEYKNARLREWDAHYAWLRWLETMEASLAEYRLAYLWWAAQRGVTRASGAAMIKAVGSFMLPLLLAIGACVDDGQVHVALLCDRSTSGAEAACPAGTVVEIGRLWADAAQTRGGRFEIWVFGRGIEPTRLGVEDYPRRFKPPVSESKRAWRAEFEARLAARAAELPTHGGSAIAEGVWRVARRLNEAGPGRKILVLATDLRQVTPGVWNFERHVPRPLDFVRWLDVQGLGVALPEKIELLVCGFHSESPSATSRASAANYNRTRALWQQVFASWGAGAQIREDCGS